MLFEFLEHYSYFTIKYYIVLPNQLSSLRKIGEAQQVLNKGNPPNYRNMFCRAKAFLTIV